jgi:hemolysin III
VSAARQKHKGKPAIWEAVNLLIALDKRLHMGEVDPSRVTTSVSDRSHLCDSHDEEVASLLTHAVGVVFSIVALVVMVVLSAGDVLKTVAAVIFGTSLVVLYTSSTLYHFFTHPQWKARFQVLDHACIYLLIAGSYTPITLITLNGAWGWSLFGTVWAMALGGVLMKALWKGKKDHWISTFLYLLMGWLIIFAFDPLLRGMPAAGIWWLVGGGLAYSLGVVFFAWGRLPFNHAIWHLFVMGGSMCHVLAACLFVFR